MRISTIQLRMITEKLLRHLEASGHSSIELSHDFYWHLPENQTYELSGEPTEQTVGQLSDDWAELQKLLDTDREAIAYDFVWLAAILRAIGEQLVS